MATVQCKMCGGTLDLSGEITCGECPYCGSMTTFPRLRDAQTEQLYNRAEHFRQISDFDKAAAAYEELIRMGGNDAEMFWGLVLSRFGIEYVEDPTSHERIPTCHRAQFESILADSDYLRALELASGNERAVYETEAKRISEILKGILQISSQEEPYDVFICYKETADDGKRTKDSALAQDIYYQLTTEGYKVFFARITLEDKLGSQYEPHIFAALNSAKVMLVIGSKKEYFEAVWVKNEWSRFLALMKKDHSKLLIPCFKDMDAYDIPQELSMLQSQDMSKIGFIQDLLRGIKKVLSPNTDAAARTQNLSANSGVTNLVSRVKIFMGDKDWESATQYCERILDQDATNSEAYLLKCLIDAKMASLEQLVESDFDFLADANFKKAVKFASSEQKKQIDRALRSQQRRFFEKAVYLKGQHQIQKAIEILENCCKGFPGAADELKSCQQLIGDQEYRVAVQLMEQGKYDEAINKFNLYPHYLDSSERIMRCRTLQHNRRKKKIFWSAVVVGVVIAVVGICIGVFSDVDVQYSLGKKHYDAYHYAKAVKWFHKAAEQGHANAQYHLGKLYFSGEGVTRDYAEAVKWYGKAAEQGHAEAQYSLGSMYATGRGVTRDDAEAVKWFCKAAEQGDYDAKSALEKMDNRKKEEMITLYNLGVKYYNEKNFAEAVKWYRKAAEQGYAHAQNNLGLMYKNGLGVTRDYAEAVKCFRKAAEQGEAYAQNNLGDMYESGRGVTRDDAEAVKWYRKAAEQESAYAHYNLGYMYENGRGVTRDYTEAVKWYRKAAEQGYASAQNDLGVMYANGRGVTRDYAEAVKWYRKAAEQGYAYAQSNLGNMYANGRGVTRDDAEAVKWYRKAAEQGNAYAQINLGNMYNDGRGVTRDDAEAVKWYRKAAEQGNAAAQYKLGYMYYSCRGVTGDYAEAVKWYRKAAEQGYAAAQCFLGIMYAHGWGVTRDDAEAVKWYRKAAEQGYAAAQNHLGDMYAKGRGVPRDDAEAVKWYRKAAEQGNAAAQRHLGDMYVNGCGVTGDYAEAVKWYRKSAEQGDADAQYKLGAMYVCGWGVTSDFAEAAKWFRKSAEQGNDNAQNTLGAMYLNGNGVTRDYDEAKMWFFQAVAKGNANAQYNLGYMYENGHGVTRNINEAVKWYRMAAEQGHVKAKKALQRLQRRR